MGKKAPAGMSRGQTLVFNKKSLFGGKRSPCGNVEEAFPGFKEKGGAYYCRGFINPWQGEEGGLLIHSSW